VDTRAQLAKLIEIRDLLPTLKRVIITDGARRAGDWFVVAFDALRSSGAERLERDSGSVDERSRQVRPEDLATIVYTSGTSGPPKGPCSATRTSCGRCARSLLSTTSARATASCRFCSQPHSRANDERLPADRGRR